MHFTGTHLANSAGDGGGEACAGVEAASTAISSIGSDPCPCGSFLIDRVGKVHRQVVNDLPSGRDVDEMLRVIDALQFTEEHGEVCPAGWQKGKAGMGASPEGVAAYLAKHVETL